jgi:hypothetical protein
VVLTIRLPARVRWLTAAAVVGLCAGGVVMAMAVAMAMGIGRSDERGLASGLASRVAVAHARLAGFSTQRLTSELAVKYGFHFIAPATAADPGSVDIATARDGAGDQLRVIVFGGAPEQVHGLVCEFTPAQAAGTSGGAGATGTVRAAAEASAPAPAPAAAGFLAACATLGAGPAQAGAAVHWIAQAQAGLSASTAVRSDQGRLTAAARFAAVGYVVRRLPETGEWIMVMSGADP